MSVEKDYKNLSPLARAISEYTAGHSLPMHMPGHKRSAALPGALPYELDITEIAGFDDLHRARGILLRAEERAAGLWKSRRCFFLVGGSTCGILAAVRAATKPGDTVLVARNCHRSVYHAIELCALRPVYLFPEADQETGIAGSIAPEQVKKALTGNPEAVLVVLTSPTYEGVISDLEGVAAAAHGFDVPVLVDGAHGAHLGFSPYFPKGPVACGADIVVMSLHKTLPALTQTALLHFSGGLIDDERLGRELSVFETSSPSYVLMASIDLCVGLLQDRGKTMFADFEKDLEDFYGRMQKLKNLKIFGPDGPTFFGFDRGKIVITTRSAGVSGAELSKNLRERFGIEVEMACAGYIVAIASICDTKETLGRFADALLAIDVEFLPSAKSPGPFASPIPEVRIPSHDAVFRRGNTVGIFEAEGRTALEYLWAYPPGIPLVVPGEAVTVEVLRTIREMTTAGVTVVSSSGSGAAIRCDLG
ncbi:MAG: aminotransferase class V-fold PLP-dependent enzyme [Clostridia bacterium]|nr:aminotransferase class V-fold PLP-dependent enzyme [Clostridia bacterium]